MKDNSFNNSRVALNIEVGPSCNNNCIFCCEPNRYFDVKKEHVLMQLREMIGQDNVIFSHKEPTLNKELEFYVTVAKDLGYKTIGLSTNGRMLSYEKYCKKLLRKGVNELIISIHGHNKSLHDSLTRSPGSFDQTKIALKNLNSLKKHYNFKLYTATTICKLNMDFMDNITDFLQDFCIDSIIFNVIEPRGNALEKFKTLIPRYTDIMKKFNNMKNREKVILEGIPFCLIKDSINKYFGLKETQYIYKNNNLILKNFKEKIKNRECIHCKLFEKCDGIWDSYINSYGWEEFIPIK
jgi:MoaA/NifB/PqqE/SkfB family radical SAM enzyme